MVSREEGYRSIWKKAFSLYPFMGNVGTVSILMNIMAGLANPEIKTFDSVDEDIYGRYSFLKVRRC